MYCVPQYCIQYAAFIHNKRVEEDCIPFGNAIVYVSGQMYYWLSLTVNFFLPFILLTIMNSVIIKTLKNRPVLKNSDQCQGQSEDHTSKLKNAEKHSLFVYVMLYNYEKSPPNFCWVLPFW